MGTLRPGAFMLVQGKFLNPRLAASGPDVQFRVIFDRHPHPSWIVDRATFRVLAVNAAAADQLGCRVDELLDITYLDLLAPEEAISLNRRLVQQGSSRGPFHMRIKTRRGELIHAHVSWRPVPFNRVPAILITTPATDPSWNRLVAETEEGRTRLEALSRRLVGIQEAERAEIARELHDEIGQLLTGLKLMMTSPGPKGDGANGRSPLAASVPEMVQVVSELIGRVRDLSMNLRPPMLDEMGLVSALQWHFERFTKRGGIRVSFPHALAGRRFPADVEIAAFRIIQEALTNAARHAEVQDVTVGLEADPKYLRVRIEDLGHGFNPDVAPVGHSTGLTGMKERALLIGGQLTIESAPSSGTRILVELPLRGTVTKWNQP